MGDILLNKFTEMSKELSVLVCDDDNDILKTMKEMLDLFFKKVDTAQDGKEALELYEKGKYDIIITDIMMPEMTGPEMIKEIRKVDEDQIITVMSGMKEEDILIELIDYGVISFLSKPVDRHNLMATLIKVLNKITIRKERTEKGDKKVFDSLVVALNHTINQKLTIILGHIEMCQVYDNDRVPNSIKKSLEEIGRASFEIAEILEKLKKIDKVRFKKYFHDTDMIDIEGIY